MFKKYLHILCEHIIIKSRLAAGGAEAPRSSLRSLIQQYQRGEEVDYGCDKAFVFLEPLY